MEDFCVGELGLLGTADNFEQVLGYSSPPMPDSSEDLDGCSLEHGVRPLTL